MCACHVTCVEVRGHIWGVGSPLLSWVLRTKLRASGLDATTHQTVSVVFYLWPQCLSGMAPETQSMYDTCVLGEWILL